MKMTILTPVQFCFIKAQSKIFVNREKGLMPKSVKKVEATSMYKSQAEK
jgi:hypothetical protein